MISLEFCQTFKNYTMPVPHRTLPENWRTGHTSQFILEDSIAILLKADKDITRKKNHRPIFLMNIGVKSLNKFSK